MSRSSQLCPCGSNLDVVIRWNERARELVAAAKTNPPMASRVYAYLSVAQREVMRRYSTDLDAISAAILSFFYPDAELARFDALSCDARSIVDRLLVRARSDGSDAIWSGTIPVGPGFWTGTNPLLPLWGWVRTWILRDVRSLRAPPPPAFGSPRFLAALREVRQISDTRTAAQLRIAKFWADGAGTATPPGHWNQIACDLLRTNGVDAAEATQILAWMNAAMMDAGICCWGDKYVYWLLRPSQADPAITTPVGLPNFPSYTSGHASFSGAASEILASLLPCEAKSVRAMAEEAALSRLYGGIHYRFDSDRGLEVGREIAEIAKAEIQTRWAPSI